MSAPDTGSAKRSSGADDNDYLPLPKRSRTSDVVLGINPSPPTRPKRPDYSGGHLVSFCSPFFPDLRIDLGRFLVDKTQLIENIVTSRMNGLVDLVLRPRRCGKTTMLQMLNSFFSFSQDSFNNVDLCDLFSGLYIADKHEICRDHMGKYPVIFCDFQRISGTSWDEMLGSFKFMVSRLYHEWKGYLWDSLEQGDQDDFQSFINEKASLAMLKISLERLTKFLHKKSGQKVIVLIDEYEVPNNRAYEFDFFEQANEFFGRGVLPNLLKSNVHIAYGLLVGVIPVVNSEWYSGLNNVKIHALHEIDSVFAGMLMFTEAEIVELRRLKKSELDPEALKAHYSSYLAGGCISVYNPVSVMSAFEEGVINNFWVATGEFPFSDRKIPEGVSFLNIIEKLLSRDEVSFELQDSVSFSKWFNSTLNMNETLTLLYYAGYLTQTTSKQFKIPNREVMVDWTGWITGNVEGHEDILDSCIKGPVSIFEERWPNFMLQRLDAKAVANARCAVSSTTPERIYHVYFQGLIYTLERKGWEVTMEARAGGGYLDIRLVSKKTQSAVLIELKSSEKLKAIKNDAQTGLKRIIDKNYRNLEGLTNIRFLREYGIASYHLDSHVKGRYLELDSQRRWVEKDDPNQRSL